MISVIVPIYNTEEYLDKCLDSIKNQSYTDFEVIMVDDGSTDRSAEICKKYEIDDSRFKYFYKENGGSSSARNFGIDNSKGKYIAFIDSDDYIDKDYLRILEAPTKEKEYTIVQCGMKLIRKGVETPLVPLNGEYDGYGFSKLVLKREIQIFLFQTAVTKLYCRQTITKNNLRMNETISISEDCLFNTELLPNINSVKLIDYAGYYYQQDNSTLTKANKTYKMIHSSVDIGNRTSEIRYHIIQHYGWQDDLDVIKGFQTTICIIYISNAQMIENGDISQAEKEKLYDMYFAKMNYPIDIAVNDYLGTDKIIALASANKDSKTISRIYKLRSIKKKLLSVFRR